MTLEHHPYTHTSISNPSSLLYYLWSNQASFKISLETRLLPSAAFSSFRIAKYAFILKKTKRCRGERSGFETTSRHGSRGQAAILMIKILITITDRSIEHISIVVLPLA